MKNMEIRIEMTKHGLKQWQLANLLEMSESALSRKLRKELPDNEKQQILGIINSSLQAVKK